MKIIVRAKVIVIVIVIIVIVIVLVTTAVCFLYVYCIPRKCTYKTWGWNLRLKPEVPTWGWNLRLEPEVGTWDWNLRLEPEVPTWGSNLRLVGWLVGWLSEAQKEKGVLTADSFQSQDEKKNGGLAYQEQQMTKEIPSIPASLPVMLKREARKIGPAEILLIKNEKLPLRHSWPPSHTNAICEKWPTLVGHFCFKAGDPPLWVTLARITSQKSVHIEFHRRARITLIRPPPQTLTEERA